MVDARGNLWYARDSGLYVRWGGLDYAFGDGRWLSPTRFQAGYDFNASIPRGNYQSRVDGAVGSDGIGAYGNSTNTFVVDYGGAVTTLPPLPPTAQAETDGSLAHMGATWQAKDGDVDFYRYAIGTLPGGRDVVGWTYLAGTGMARHDLQLRGGQTYYVTVQARNTSRLWSADGVSNPVVAGTVTNPTPTPTSTTEPGNPTPTPTPTAEPGNPTPTPTPTTEPATSTLTPTATPTTPATDPSDLPVSTTIPSDSGGELTGDVGASTVRVNFLPGTHGGSFTVTLQPLAQVPGPDQFNLLGRGFSITAVDSSGQPVTQFQQPFTIIVHYNAADLQGMDPAALVLHYWDAETERWQSIPTVVDPAAQTLTATLDHLTVFAVLESQGIFLPMINR